MNFTFGATNEVADGTWRIFIYGELHILVARSDDEWRYTSWMGEAGPAIEGTSGKCNELPDTIDFVRWDCAPEDTVITLEPSFPDLALMAKPRGRIHIPSGGEAQFLLGVPAFVKLTAQCEGRPQELARLASYPLSKTWHGNQHKGQTCYALRTSARRNSRHDLAVYAQDILCQVQIVNKSDTPAQFERIYLETGHHAIYQRDGQLWGNACRIRIADQDDDFSRITYSDSPLTPATDASLIVEAALGKARKSTLRNAFSSFFDVLSR